ncbi:Acyltransferase [Caenorhabditis elegans]|uniref:Acyltransferase n=1 Tax=Caenorhabditis elegans TaxID=6239 RepID=O17792_CAEEL|nr:Acyltransferase [Caenorhabditis elegans]CAB07360.1 Acyltransferase [Caenorhabditis elegans]|eukprot:NP_507088.1 O-ACyltransferase homolog [Caenorhabditis elegans]
MRLDIQCLRGLAIFFVFTYHLYPTIFVNGYLGVDIFFVISGYLMARNLAHVKITKVSQIFGFYYRRFRRILPLYFLSTAVTLAAAHFYLGEFWWDVNRRYSTAATFLVTNMLLIHDSNDYFKQYLTDETSINTFIHTWSLGVEMQFYLLVPLIFVALQIGFPNNPVGKLAIVSGISILVMCGFSLINANFAFNFMPLRLWQFGAGFVALFLREVITVDSVKKSKRSETVSTKWKIHESDVATCSAAVLFLCIFPAEGDALWLRPLITFTTALLIFIENKSCGVLKCSTLSYLGDISYVMYLVHWPVISLLKNSTVQSNVFCVALTILMSVMIHHFYEKQYLKLGRKSTFFLILLLIGLNGCVQWSTRNHELWKPVYSQNIRKIVDENSKLLPFILAYEPRKEQCLENLEADVQDLRKTGLIFNYCRFPKSNGTVSIMMAGNSYVTNLEGHIRAQFNGNYSDWRTLYIDGCNGFFHNQNLLTSFGTYEQSSIQIVRKQVELHKPNVLLIVPRYTRTLKQPILDIETDEVLRIMNENLAFYERFVKKIYILAPHPLYPLNFMNRYLNTVTRKPMELESLHLKKSDVDEDWMTARERFSRIKCEKCKVFDLGDVFLENNMYLTFDRQTKLSYVDNGIHLTGPGVAKCDKVFRDIAKEILETI